MIRPEENLGGEPREGVRLLLLMLDELLAKRRWPENPDANELFYEAIEAPTDEQEVDLLNQVLDLDPAHVDALLGLLDHVALELDEEIEVLRRLLQLAGKRLGAKAFKEFDGHFWGFFETRPYMRVRDRLARTLKLDDQTDEAIKEWEGMLDLNPNDNQGVRYELLASYLQRGRLIDAGQLFKKYDETDFNVVFSWCRVLVRCLTDGGTAAQEALSAARKQNAHVEAYLTRRKRLPKTLPPHYSTGSKEEAVCFAETLMDAWKAHPIAYKWLRDLKGK